MNRAFSSGAYFETLPKTLRLLALPASIRQGWSVWQWQTQAYLELITSIKNLRLQVSHNLPSLPVACTIKLIMIITDESVNKLRLHMTHLEWRSILWCHARLYGDTWRYMAILGNTWQYLAILGNTWQYLTIPTNSKQYLPIQNNAYQY